MDYQAFRDQLNHTPDFSRTLGLTVTSVECGKAETELPVLPEFRNPFRSVHGGILFTVADVTGGIAAYSYGSAVCTVDSTLHYLNAGLDTQRLFASSAALKAGKRLIVVDVSVRDENGVLLCKGTFTYSKLNISADLPG